MIRENPNPDGIIITIIAAWSVPPAAPYFVWYSGVASLTLAIARRTLDEGKCMRWWRCLVSETSLEIHVTIAVILAIPRLRWTVHHDCEEKGTGRFITWLMTHERGAWGWFVLRTRTLARNSNGDGQRTRSPRDRDQLVSDISLWIFNREAQEIGLGVEEDVWTFTADNLQTLRIDQGYKKVRIAEKQALL